MKRLVALATVALAASVLVGCSSTIDVSSLEEQVQKGMAEQLGGEWTVQCPDSMEVKAGLTANCEATSTDGTTEQVNITQTDDQGNVTWEVPSTDLDVDKLEASLQTEIAAQAGGEWTVQCPDSIPLQKDLTANCEATNADGQSVMINVTQTDDQGSVSWESAE